MTGKIQVFAPILYHVFKTGTPSKYTFLLASFASWDDLGRFLKNECEWTYRAKGYNTLTVIEEEIEKI